MVAVPLCTRRRSVARKLLEDNVVIKSKAKGK